MDASASFRIARFMMALLLVAPLSGYSAHAVEPDEILQDQALENRARALSAKLRCVVCQNQSIDDSNAPLAKDLRVIVRERLVAGDSDAAVLDHVVARYGEFVLLQPRFALHTALLWGLPPALLVLSIGLLWWRRTRNEDITASGTNVAAPLNAREMERVQEIVTGRET